MSVIAICGLPGTGKTLFATYLAKKHFKKDNGIQYIFMLTGFSYGIWENNRKQTYIEKNAYRQIHKK